MPNISSPTDGGHQYYKKIISELEDELSDSAKRAEAHHQKRLKKQEESHKTDLAKRDRELERTINKVKEDTNTTISQERESNHSEAERIRKQTYDKFARHHGNDAEALRNQLQKHEESAKHQRAKDAATLDATREANYQKLEELDRRHGQKLESSLKTALDSANDSHSLIAAELRTQNKEDRTRFERINEDLQSDHTKEINAQRSQSVKGLHETKLSYERRLNHETDATGSRLAEQQRQFGKDSEAAIKQANASHENETEVLRDQISALIDHERNYIGERARNTAVPIAEYENETRLKLKNATEEHEKEIEKIKQAHLKKEAHLGRMNNKNLKEKDEYFSKLISNQNVEHHLDRKDLLTAFESDHNQAETRIKRDREQSDKALAKQSDDANENTSRALEHQAKAYQKTFEQQQISTDDKIKLLENQLREKSTSQDTLLISPAAESNVRKSVIAEYEKGFQAELERNNRTTESIKQAYSQRLKEAVVKNEARETDLSQSFAAEKHQDKTEFLQHIQETEFMRNLSLKNKDQENAKQTENINRSYTGLLERQRREFEEIFSASKNDAAAKLASVRNEAEFNTKMNHRTFSARQSELIRDYEKRITDQKLQYESQMDDLRHQSNQTVREAERKSKQYLNEQGQSYEQRISKLEIQNKERERLIAEQHQEQLEKLKRTHALIIQKKS